MARGKGGFGRKNALAGKSAVKGRRSGGGSLGPNAGGKNAVAGFQGGKLSGRGKGGLPRGG